MHTQNDLYIYYKVAAIHAQQFEATATHMLAQLSSQYHVVTALKRSLDYKEKQHTWMEVYTSVPLDFIDLIEQAALQCGLLKWINGPRRTEYFMNISSCA